MSDLVLRASDGHLTATVDVAVASGGRIRQISIEQSATTARLLADAPLDAPASSTGWGSFPMAPWAGRIRHGRFRFLDRDVSLDLNHADGFGTGGGPIDPPTAARLGPIRDEDRRLHAIHGTTFARAWTVDAEDDTTCELSCALTGALGWPYAGVARQRLELHPDRLELTLTVEADDDAAFPASIGWHPWFAKPDRLEFRPVAMYAHDEIGLPTGELVAPTAPPWDHCFVNHDPIRLHYDREVAPTITLTADTDHWVVYDAPPHATCVEAQSGPPDSPTVRPCVVAPGHPLQRTLTIAW
jgi:aldose 1-epimerase